MTNESAKFETLKLLCLLFRTDVWKDIRIALQAEVSQGQKISCLQACPCIFQPGKFTGWGSEGVNQSVKVQAVVLPVLASTVFKQIVTAVSAVSVPSKLGVTEILPV